MTCPDAVDSVVREHHLALSLLVRSGSKAYGIDVPESDDDFAGVFIPPLRRFVSIRGIERDTYTGNDPDFTLHEIGKFCRLALQGNPAILEALWNPGILACDDYGRALIDLRARILHRGSLEVYVAYARSQLKKMLKGGALHAKGGVYNGKFGAHLVRLLHAGIGLAATGEVMVRVPAALSSILLKIRSGEISMAQVQEIAGPLFEELQRLAAGNSLPARPDETAVDELVIRARLSRS